MVTVFLPPISRCHELMSRVEPKIFHVIPDEADRTLASLLRQRLTDKPWSEVRRLIRSRHVLINGYRCMDAGRRL